MFWSYVRDAIAQMNVTTSHVRHMGAAAWWHQCIHDGLGDVLNIVPGDTVCKACLYICCNTHLANRLEIAGNATPSPAPIMPLEMQRGINMYPRSAAVGVNTVKRDHRTTPPPSTTLEEYLVAT